MSNKLICFNCGQEFESKYAACKKYEYKTYGKKYYCSKECRLNARGFSPVNETQCANCGKTFLPSENTNKRNKSNNKFCCSSCAASYNNKNRKGKISKESKNKTAQTLIARNYAIRELLNLPQGKKMSRNIKNNKVNFKLVKDIKESLTEQDLLDYSKTTYNLDKLATIDDICAICPVCGKKFYKAGTDQMTCSLKCGNTIISKKRIKKLMKDGISGNTKVGRYRYKNFTINCDSKLEVAAFKLIVDEYKPKSIKRCDFYIPYIDEENVSRNYFPDFIFENTNGKYIVEVKCAVKKKNTTLPKYTKNLKEKEKCLEKYANENNMTSLWVDFSTCPGLRKIYNQTLDEFKNKKEQ